MPKVTQQIGGKAGIRSQGQTQWLPIQGSSHSSMLLPQPKGHLSVQNCPSHERGARILQQSTHSRKSPYCWRLDEHREGHWWQLLAQACGSTPPSPVTGPALLCSQSLMQSFCGGPAADPIQSWTCFMGISSS